MKTRLLIMIAFIGLMIPISNAFATEPRIIPIFQPDMELIPGENIIYGESFTIHAWLESYDNFPDGLGFHVDVLDPFHNQVDSTLWFAKQDFVYEFDTTHPAYNITKSGTYQIKIERADLMQRTGIFLKTISFEILFPEPEQDEPIPENCGPGTTLQDGICVADKDGYALARIQWPDRCYAATHVGTVRVIEADNNFDSSKPDSFKIQVWSNHDKNHVLDITVTETGNDTNIFEGTIPFGEIGDESLQNRLYISEDITIMAKYVDRTLPPNILYSEVPVTLGTKVKITPYDFPPSREYYDGKKIPYDPCVMQVLGIAKEKGQDLSWLNVEFPSPLQQVKSGLLKHEVVCKQGLTLIFSADYLPACVMPDSVAKLFERGWITHHTASGLFPTSVKIHEDTFRDPDKVIPLLFMNELIYRGIAYENQKTEYSNTDEGYLETTRVCSPLVSQNGSKFFISAVFHPEPFEITGVFIDDNPPDDCHKYLVTPTGFFLRAR